MSNYFDRGELLQRIKTVQPSHFGELALAVFRYQATHNPVYAQFLELIGVDQAQVRQVADIPCLPIQLFKRYQLQSGDWHPELIFTSSGTTGQTTSQHLLRDRDFYRYNARRSFAQFYGSLDDYTLLALLPSYLERSGSSLIFMAQDFIEQTRDDNSGFFLSDTAALFQAIEQARLAQRKIMLLGVSFALLDLAEQFPQDLSDVIVMETGGMKGRRKEITRTELHGILQEAFHLPEVHSEYGMTELLSQAYSKGQGVFYPAASMKILIREVTDPRARRPFGRSGAIDIIDLANLDTISFIATEDLGKQHPDGGFEILGRLDAGDIRGCNLMIE